MTTTSKLSLSSVRRRRLLARLTTRRPLLVAAAVLLLGFAAWTILFSSWFAARQVAVVGERTLSADAVATAARVPVGTPLARLDLSQIEARVAALPAVGSVSVSRSWPHTVSIQITERQAVAAIRRDGGWWVVDAHGVPFRRTAQRDQTVPLVAVPPRAGGDAVEEAASVISSLPASLLAQTRRLTAHSMDSITLRLKDKSSVVWGNAAESDRKVEVLEAMLAHIKAAQYDVSVPEQPTTSG
jgi:cell division protein FtsQ